ncbi:MAG: hypothetical protein ACK5N8_04725 [Alphaproteobacteria bacterium]
MFYAEVEMKKLGLFIFLFGLLGCVSAPEYVTLEKKQDVVQYFEENINFLPPNYYNKQAIIETFGKPSEEIKEGQTEVLKYIVPDESGNTLKYAFVLEKGQLKTIVYEDFILALAQYGLVEGGFRPWISRECEQGEENQDCLRDKLLKQYSQIKLQQGREKTILVRKIYVDKAFVKRINLKTVQSFYQKQNFVETVKYQKEDRVCSVFEKEQRASAFCKFQNKDEIMLIDVVQKEKAQDEVIQVLEKD